MSKIFPPVVPEPPLVAHPRIALDRTMRLMRDDLQSSVTDAALITALLQPRVIVAADAANLASPAAQSAFVSTVLLLLRSGVAVGLHIPDVPLLGPQPPLIGERLMPALIAAGADLIEGVACVPDGWEACDLAIVLGDTQWTGQAHLVLRISGGAFKAQLTVAPNGHGAGTRWPATLSFPFGALAAAGLAAGEVYKYVMRSLSYAAIAPDVFGSLFASAPCTDFTLDPDGEIPDGALETLGDFGTVDAISGGAIIQALLFSMARVPGATGFVRVIEPEAADATNLNRYALLLRSMLGVPKALSLTEMQLGALQVEPIIARYDYTTPATLGGMADAVVVGVDDIPTRWAAQKAYPQWLGIGATSHYSAMSSDHVWSMPCAWCLHPSDGPDLGPIPTVAFVSHWAGLLLGCRLVRHRLGLATSMRTQYDYLTPLRADLPAAFWRSPVASRPDCPNRCGPVRRVA